MSARTPSFLVPLASLDGIAALGNKAANLARVATIRGVVTPRGFAIPGETVSRYLAPFRAELREIVRGTGANDAHAAIEELLLAAPLDFDGDLARFLRDDFPAATLFAVRSSAQPVVNGDRIAEDSKAHSLAGQYESFLRVPIAQVAHAVTRCCASLFNSRSIDLFRPQDDDSYFNSTMTVLVQEMIEASASGVMMTMDPLAVRDGIETIGIEASYGACEAIVAGKVQGDLYLVDRSATLITETELGSKRWRMNLPVYGEAGAVDLVATDPNTRGASALTHDEVLSIARVGMEVEALFGMPQDVEFVLDEQRRLVITQARPITTLN